MRQAAKGGAKAGQHASTDAPGPWHDPQKSGPRDSGPEAA